MSEARWRTGDVFERMADIPDGSIDLIVTSPPFLALRSYLPADHPDKAKEIGSEDNPAMFLSVMLALTREWRRILAPHGSIAVELGDKYSGSGGAGGDYDEDGLRDGQPKFGRTGDGPGWPLAKSLCLLPTLYPASLAYGRNLLAPDDTVEPWRVRNLIVWHRPNPPVGALGDKVRPSTSYITTACVSDKRWFDLDSERSGEQTAAGGSTGRRLLPGDERKFTLGPMPNTGSHPAGAPLLDCWTIPTAPYAGSHYATFPPALPRRLINLMCPRQVCVVCGEPRRRIVETVNGTGRLTERQASTRGKADGEANTWRALTGSTCTENITLGWTDCDCPDDFDDFDRPGGKYRRGIVLDPFAGSGTTLQAASELGRDSIGIDLDSRNLDLARSRLGMFLVEEESVP